MENTHHVREVLNDLVEINNDRIAGYQRAIRESTPEDEDLKILFASMIAESHRIRMALGTEVEVLGADIEKGTTTSGKIYRAWMDVKAIFTCHDRHSILVACEGGEDAAQRAYASALEEDGIPLYIREMLTRQKDTLREFHDEIKVLRDQYSDAAVSK